MDIQSAGVAPDSAAKSTRSWHLWAGKSFSFHDVLDAINPLQHLPIISTIYRHLTGDNIGNAARVLGDTLYGGPIGLAVSLVQAHEVNKTGSDIGDHVLAMVEGGKTKTPGAPEAPPVLLAAAPAPTTDPVSASVRAPIGADGTISMAAALAALPDRPPVDLPSFPSNAAAPQAASIPAALPPVAPAAAPARQIASVAPLLGPSPKGFAIDTSSSGIAAMRARSQSGVGVPFQLPAGVMLTNQPQPLPVASATDFALKMKQGLAKYQALLAQQAAHHPLAAQPTS